MLNDKASAAVVVADAVVAAALHAEGCCGRGAEECGVGRELRMRVRESAKAYAELPGVAGEQREPLPSFRRGYNLKAALGGHKVYLRTGQYPDGRLGDIFIDAHKQGATLRSMFACFAISVSLGLQYGVPLQEFVDAFVGMKFEPSGPVTGHEQIEEARSIIDFFFTELALQYGAELPEDVERGQLTDV